MKRVSARMKTPFPWKALREKLSLGRRASERVSAVKKRPSKEDLLFAVIAAYTGCDDFPLDSGEFINWAVDKALTEIKAGAEMKTALTGAEMTRLGHCLSEPKLVEACDALKKIARTLHLKQRSVLKLAVDGLSVHVMCRDEDSASDVILHLTADCTALRQTAVCHLRKCFELVQMRRAQWKSAKTMRSIFGEKTQKEAISECKRVIYEAFMEECASSEPLEAFTVSLLKKSVAMSNVSKVFAISHLVQFIATFLPLSQKARLRRVSFTFARLLAPMRLTEEGLVGRKFEFVRAPGSAGTLTLAIHGETTFAHPNEGNWRVADGRLAFFHRLTGARVTQFHDAILDKPTGKYYIEGLFLADSTESHWYHILREVGLSPSVGLQMPRHRYVW